MWGFSVSRLLQLSVVALALLLSVQQSSAQTSNYTLSTLTYLFPSTEHCHRPRVER